MDRQRALTFTTFLVFPIAATVTGPASGALSGSVARIGVNETVAGVTGRVGASLATGTVITLGQVGVDQGFNVFIDGDAGASSELPSLQQLGTQTLINSLFAGGLDLAKRPPVFGREPRAFVTSVEGRNVLVVESTGTQLPKRLSTLNMLTRQNWDHLKHQKPSSPAPRTLRESIPRKHWRGD